MKEIRKTYETVVIVAPNSMAYRMVTESKIFTLLHQNGVKKIFLLGHRMDVLTDLPEYVEWRSAFEPEPDNTPSVASRVLRSIQIRIRRVLGWDFANLAYRFNEIHGFRSHQIKKCMPPKRRQREALAGNYADPRYARLFPRSKRLYQLFYRICYSLWFLPHPPIRRFFDKNHIDRLVLWHVQSPLYVDYSWCVRVKGIITTGVLGSWDRPTTKGPICPGVSHLIVNSMLMEKELMQFHGVDQSQISVVGWPHLDVYTQTDTYMSEEQFRQQAGLTSEERFILFAANSSRLGKHEPDIIASLAQVIDQRRFGENIRLLIRPHPADNEWQERFQSTRKYQCVSLMPTEMGNIRWLANLLNFAKVLVAIQGSISLDAIALDTPAINLAFDNSMSSDSSESVKRLYEMDHYQPVIESGGVRLVHDEEELYQAIEEYLENPEKDAEGREKLRQWQFGPFDGRSSEWAVKAILE